MRADGLHQPHHNRARVGVVGVLRDHLIDCSWHALAKLGDAIEQGVRRKFNRTSDGPPMLARY